MKLSKVYSNKEGMKSIRFNGGVNIVYAKKVFDENSQEERDEHDLGKTSLLEIIDFLLLKKNSKEFFLHQHNEFKDWTFFLEIELRCGEYLTIKRSISNPNKISIHPHKAGDQDFSNFEEWTYNERSFGGKKEKSAYDILDEILDINVPNSDYDYRKFLSFILRSQENYTDVFEMQSFSEGLHIDWKPYVFGLFGYDEVKLRNKYLLADDYAKISKVKDLSLNSISDGEEEAILELKKEELSELEVLLQENNTYEIEKRFNRSLVDKVEKGIKLNNIKRYKIQKANNQLIDSLKKKSC